MKCPLDKAICPCPEYSKEGGLCDYPYRNGMTLEECQRLTHEKCYVQPDKD